MSNNNNRTNTTLANRTTTTSPNRTTTTTKPTTNNDDNNNDNDNDNKLLVTSYYLLKHCKLWVWDFDDTLIDTKYYYKSNMEPEAIRKRTDAELTKEVPQWKYFKRLVIYLVSHGKYVGIASFGTYEIIQAYMNRILGFNQTFFNKKNIIAPMYQDRVCRRFQPPPNKNEYIYKMMKLYKVEDFKSVVLFDDLPSNIADAIGVGIVGIQMATPSSVSGDKYGSGGVSYSGGRGHGVYGIFFGPWNMVDFDKKIENECGKELYLNRTYTGITNRFYQAKKIDKIEKMESVDSKNRNNTNNTNNANNTNNTNKKNNNDTPFKGLSYDKTNFRNGIHESFTVPAAFGTGIGNRKITMSPEVRWNNMNVRNPPQWVNGNWEEATLGGTSSSYWDKHQKVMKNNDSDNDEEIDEDIDEDIDNDEVIDEEIDEEIDNDNDDKYSYNNIKSIGITPYNGKLNEASNYVMGVTEGFSNSDTAFQKSRAKTAFQNNDTAFQNNDDDDEYDIKSKFGLLKKNGDNNDNDSGDDNRDKNCETCKKLEWNWIILVLIVIILMMTVIIYNVV